MPFTWISFSTATAPILKGKSPLEMKEAIQEVVGDALLEVYFDIGKEVGYAHCKDLGESKNIKLVTKQIGALGVTKMLDADQAEEALAPLRPPREE
jgi:hypothetical protein